MTNIQTWLLSETKWIDKYFKIYLQESHRILNNIYYRKPTEWEVSSELRSFESSNPAPLEGGHTHPPPALSCPQRPPDWTQSVSTHSGHKNAAQQTPPGLPEKHGWPLAWDPPNAPRGPPQWPLQNRTGASPLHCSPLPDRELTPGLLTMPMLTLKVCSTSSAPVYSLAWWLPPPPEVLKAGI